MGMESREQQSCCMEGTVIGVGAETRVWWGQAEGESHRERAPKILLKFPLRILGWLLSCVCIVGDSRKSVREEPLGKRY